MTEPWIDMLENYLYINERKIEKNKLSKTDVELLHTNIVKPYNLSTKEILKLLFEDDYSITVKETAFLVLEAVIEYQNVESNDFEEICHKIISFLDIPDKRWDWLNGSATNHFNDYYSKIRLLCVLISKLASDKASLNQPLMLDILTTLSYHIHPNVPWTTKLTSELINEFINNNYELKEIIHRLLPYFVDEKLKSEVLDLSSSRTNKSWNLSLSNPKLSTAGYAKSNGIKPRLGFGGAKSAIVEEDQRQTWKLSTKVKSISMVWYLIQMISENEYLDQYWPLVTSFILNLIDDPDPLMKAQSCELLNYFLSKIDNEDYNSHLLVKSGLSDLFLEACKTSLSYLPNLTPPDQSAYLLSISYPLTLRLCGLRSKKEGNISFIELINGNILASVAHLHNRDGYGSHYKLISLLIDQLDIIVNVHLKTNVLICFSRINFTINQLMANPNIFEADIEGLNCIISSLTLQHSILQSFYNLQDAEGIKLILAYKYDFLAIWSVLQKRIELVDGFQSKVFKIFNSNFDLLKKLTSCCGQEEFESLKHDVGHILLTNPNLHFPID